MASTYWRVFPWDPRAGEGELFSPSHIPGTTGRGRFDLATELSTVLYVAETPEHAVAEALQPWRNRPLRPPHLVRAGRPLSVVEVELQDDSPHELVDLCDPSTLLALERRPDQVASRSRLVTQGIAAACWDQGGGGLRWWSAFWGDWHGVVLFGSRVGPWVRFADPAILSPDHPAVRAAADALGMRLSAV